MKIPDKLIHNICLFVMVASIGAILFILIQGKYETWQLKKQNAALLAERDESGAQYEESRTLSDVLYAGVAELMDDVELNSGYEEIAIEAPVMLPEYRSLYEENNDIIGWLYIEGTQIDYPVMQTPEDEEYYLYRDFEGNDNNNGCLILDSDSVVGVGDALHNYYLGTQPGTNLIIHGHNMHSGMMFGDLDCYQDQEYEKEHSIICFDSLYEEREYEIIAVFYSQVYRQSDDVFKYYNFFEASTEEEFMDFYSNIKELSLYDTGVTAEYGDEFITLSTCAYQTENGRFVIVGKRIY